MKRLNLIIASGIVCLLLIGFVVGVVNTFFVSQNGDIEPGELTDDLGPEPNIPEPFETTDSTRAKGGTLKWAIQIGDEELSAPAITDLNPPLAGGEADYEVVVGSAADKVAAVKKDGKLLWEFNDCVIDNAHILASGLDFDPAPFFSSVTPVDIAGGKGAEIIIGEEDGVLCLKSDGTKLWSDKGTTDGYYFSSVAVCDLEGDYKGLDADGNDVGYRDDLEIVLGSDNRQNADAYLECWQANSQEVFRYKVDLSFEHAFMTCSIVATELDGYFNMNDEKLLDDLLENNPDTLYADFLMSTHAYCGRIWSHQDGQAWDQYHEKAAVSDPGHWGGHESYATPAVGNFTGGPELEVIMGHGSGAMSWQSSDGTVRMYRQDGKEYATPFTTGSAPSSVFSSPAACDAQVVDEKDLDDDEFIEYEVYFGCDNGYFYCLSATDLSELWSYQTSGRILSSPAICNIDSDDSLEVIVGSNDGKVYCFEADPQELDRDGEPNPKDDGVEDGGGDAGTYDLLWVFDTNEVTEDVTPSGEIGISSPVVGDIDRDGQLEVLIGDTGGALYCINAGGKCVPGQVDWPMFHGDLNKTGLYNPGTSYGVKMDRGDQELPGGIKIPEKLQKSVKPGETVSYNITIQNIGTSKTFSEADTFWLSVDQIVYRFATATPDHGWSTPLLSGEKPGVLRWGYDQDSNFRPYVVLSSMQKANLTVNITAPYSGDLTELCQVEVRANSENDTFARDSVVTKTSLEITLDFDIDILKDPVKDKTNELFGQKVIKINPSDKATVEVMVSNLGNLNDTYDLSIEGVLWGWEAYFAETNTPYYEGGLSLDAKIMENVFPTKFKGSDGILKFAIEAPPDAQENEILTLKILATSQYSKESNYIDNITKFDYLIVEVNPVPDLELKCRYPRQYVTPGKNITFKVEVINRGNSKITVQLERSQLEPSWGLQFYSIDGVPYTGIDILVDVMKEAVTSINVVMSSPQYAIAGSRQDVVIKGTTTGDAALISSDSVALTAIVTQFFDINVTITPEKYQDNPYNIETDPGKTITYDIKINNSGNGNDFIIITPTQMEVNWESTFYLDEEERVTTELERNETVEFQLVIRIPKNQLAGIYPTGINISSLGDREIVTVETKINKIFNLSVFGVVHSDVTSDKILNSTIQPQPGVSPGSVLNFVYEIMNGGNDADWIIVNLDPLKPTQARDSDMTIAAWLEFEDLGWQGYFIGVTNTEAYLTDIEDLDFEQDIDISHQKSPVGYLNDENTTVRDLKIKLGVGQRIWLKVQITVPRDLPDIDDELHPNKEEPWQFKLECESADPVGKNKDVNLEDNTVDMKLKILLPDLMITGDVNRPKSPGNGEIVTISAKVTNKGDIEAKEVIVTFYVDGNEIKSQTINVMEKGRTRLIPFTWQASSGDHDLKIKIDPEDAVVEKDETNNEKSTQVTVEGNDFIEFVSGRNFCSILPLVIVGIILTIAIILYWKKGDIFGWKPGGEEGR